MVLRVGLGTNRSKELESRARIMDVFEGMFIIYAVCSLNCLAPKGWAISKRTNWPTT